MRGEARVPHNPLLRPPLSKVLLRYHPTAGAATSPLCRMFVVSISCHILFNRLLMKGFSLLLVIPMLAGCGSATESGRVLATNDFEGIDGWAPVGYLTKERAHSGQFAARVDGGAEYAANYSNPLARLSPESISKLEVKAWVYRTSKAAAASLVVEAKDPTTQQSLLYKGIELAPLTKNLNEWTLIKQSIELPPTVNPATVLRIYLWRTGQDPVYLDDFELSQPKS